MTKTLPKDHIIVIAIGAPDQMTRRGLFAEHRFTEHKKNQQVSAGRLPAARGDH